MLTGPSGGLQEAFELHTEFKTVASALQAVLA
jgi:hypothetical protein